MLGMGLTLSRDDFKRVVVVPKAVAIGVGAQFLIMPVLGFTLAKVFGLPRELALGLILVSCCPGGTASNVIAYLSKANVALSVLMTMCSTFLAVVMTPYLTKFLAGQYMDVDATSLLKSTATVVLLPLILGILINSFVPSRLLRHVKTGSPLLSVVVIVLIVGFAIGAHKEKIAEAATHLFGAVFLLHACGFSLGYFFARVFGYAEDFRRTVAIEVGMHNSGLGVKLADKHFPGTAAAAPCAISAVCHCLIGSLLASFWRARPPGKSASEGNNPEEKDIKSREDRGCLSDTD